MLPKDPTARLIFSMAIGAVAAKLVGGDANGGAFAAYYGTKYNDYRHRTRLSGEIVYVQGQGFSKVNMFGTDVYQEGWYPSPGQIYWKQNPNDQSNGWEYVAGTGIPGDPYEQDTYIECWINGYAYDPGGNKIVINGKGVFNPNIIDVEECNRVLEDVQSMYSGTKIIKGTEFVTSLLTRAQTRNLWKLDNIITNNLKETDFSGALRDLQGNPVEINGRVYDHLTEMKQSYIALQGIKDGLQGSLRNPNLNPEVRQVLSDALQKTNYYINKINELFMPHGGI
jgi:hypothetical protein